MPSGRTHDRITWYLTPVMAGFSYLMTHQEHLTVLATGAFLFSGLMFGPDLDIHSVQYKRWGWLRWLWLPYRRLLRHRSLFSHGPIIGTFLRICYLAIVLILFLALLSAITVLFGKIKFMELSRLAQAIGQLVRRYLPESLALLVGLELGSISHILSDYLGSRLKRLQTSRKKTKPSGKNSKRDQRGRRQ
jgi:uncharacterized metal-binding protein